MEKKKLYDMLFFIFQALFLLVIIIIFDGSLPLELILIFVGILIFLFGILIRNYFKHNKRFKKIKFNMEEKEC